MSGRVYFNTQSAFQRERSRSTQSLQKMKPSTRKKNHLFTPAIAAGILMAGSTAHAALLVVNVGANSTIRTTAITQQGTSQILFAGDTLTANDFLRSAVAFDLSNPLLTGATINSATVTFTARENDADSQNTAITLNLHQLTSSFTNDGVTWTSRNGTDNWTIAGGDFGGVLASASGNPRTIVAGNTMAFSSASLATAVDGAVGGTLNLLLKSDVENTTARNLFRFASTRNLIGSPVHPGPTLTIDYTPIPEPSAALLGGLGLLALLRRRR
jgi:hypothetical protein